MHSRFWEFEWKQRNLELHDRNPSARGESARERWHFFRCRERALKKWRTEHQIWDDEKMCMCAETNSGYERWWNEVGWSEEVKSLSWQEQSSSLGSSLKRWCSGRNTLPWESIAALLGKRRKAYTVWNIVLGLSWTRGQLWHYLLALLDRRWKASHLSKKKCSEVKKKKTGLRHNFPIPKPWGYFRCRKFWDIERD